PMMPGPWPRSANPLAAGDRLAKRRHKLSRRICQFGGGLLPFAEQPFDLCDMLLMPPHARLGFLALRLGLEQSNFVAMHPDYAPGCFEFGIEPCGIGVTVGKQRIGPFGLKLANRSFGLSVISAGLFKPAGSGLSATHMLSPSVRPAARRRRRQAVRV